MHDINFEQDFDPFLAGIMADDIELANSISPGGWAVFPFSDKPMFGVDKHTVTSMTTPESFTFVLRPKDLEPSVLEQIRSLSAPGGKWTPDLATYYLNVEVLRLHEQVLVASHRDAIRDRIKIKSNRWPYHKQEFVKNIERITGRNLPAPSYINEIDSWIENRESSGRAAPGYQSSKASITGYWLKGLDDNLLDELHQSGKLIELPWKDTGSLAEFPDERSIFVSEVRKKHALGMQSAHRMWMFAKSMQIGDLVAVHTNKAPMRMMIGRVTGDYSFDGENHSRDLEWITPEPVVNTTLGADVGRMTPNWLTALPAHVFTSITDQLQRASDQDYGTLSAPKREDAPGEENPQMPADPDLMQVLQSKFADAGLTYTKTQIAQFYTALQTKGFVVLSGISGTGKSKIAQHFTSMLPPGIVVETLGPDPVSTDEGLTFKLSEHETWAAVSAEQSHRFPKAPINTRFDVRYQLEGGFYTGWYSLRILAGGRPTLYFSLGKVLADKLRRSAQDRTVYAQFRRAESEGSQPEVWLYTSKPGSPSDQATENIDIPNTLFLSVRPDWRDGTSLLGYYNPLTQTYEWTDFLRHVIRAAEDWETGNPTAWFVILDEMNLAHVEYYFADLLSVLESGRVTSSESDSTARTPVGFTREAIRVTYPDTVVNDVPPSNIHLPPNLYIIGTVNMDETTHAFSPKVLDRAFTMELSEVDFSEYLFTNRRVTETSRLMTKESLLNTFTRMGWPIIDKSQVATFADANPQYRVALQRLNESLQPWRFHFGYRMFDEIIQFMVHAQDNGLFDNLYEAFDSAAFMKILPKFSGAQSRIERPLEQLVLWTQDPLGDSSISLPITSRRVEHMLQRLRDDGYVTAF